MRLVFFGAPGSGKGTQADILAEDLKLRVISLGDILREEVKKDSELGRKVKQFMGKGDLVPDAVVEEVISQNLDKDNFILDGYPRNKRQAQTLETILSKKNSSLDAFIYLDVSRDIVVDRLSKRRVCRSCRANYHLETMPSQRADICDHCGSDLIQRDDDNPEVIGKRWSVFLENSKGVFDFYKNKGIFLSIDGDNKKEKVLAEIKNKLQDKKILA